MKIPEEPEAGWGILNPDKELTEETLKVLKALDALSGGQKDAILTRCVDRQLFQEGIDNPSRSQMVICTGNLSNILRDMLGKP